MKKRMIIVASVLGAVGLLAGGGMAAYAAVTTSSEASTPDDREGAVTQQLYDEAYARFAECMREGGAALVGERSVGAVREFSYLAEARPTYESCYADFAAIDLGWQAANSYDSPTYVLLRQCLSSAGVEPGRDAETVWEQVQAEGIDLPACFESGTGS